MSSTRITTQGRPAGHTLTTGAEAPPAFSSLVAAPRSRWRRWKVLLLVAAAFLLGIQAGVYLTAGVGSQQRNTGKKVTLKTFIKIEHGMTYEEVQELFGEPGVPDVNRSTSFTQRWQGRDSAIRITFTKGKMTSMEGEFRQDSRTS